MLDEVYLLCLIGNLFIMVKQSSWTIRLSFILFWVLYFYVDYQLSIFLVDWRWMKKYWPLIYFFIASFISFNSMNKTSFRPMKTLYSSLTNQNLWDVVQDKKEVKERKLKKKKNWLAK